MKHSIIKYLGYGILGLTVLGVWAPEKSSEGASTATHTKEPVVEERSAAPDDNETEPSSTMTEDEIAAYMKSMIENLLEGSFGDRAEYWVDTSNPDVINVFFAQNGIAQDFVLATHYGDNGALNDWHELVESLRTLSENWYTTMKDLGSNKNISIFLLNDMNKDNVLVTTLNDTVLYDAVNDVQ